MEVIAWGLMGLLMILGLAQIWEWILLYLFSPKVPLLRYSIIPLSGDLENAEQLLNYIKMTSVGNITVLLDEGLSEQSRELVEILASQQPELLLLQKQDLQSIIFNEK